MLRFLNEETFNKLDYCRYRFTSEHKSESRWQNCVLGTNKNIPHYTEKVPLPVRCRRQTVMANNNNGAGSKEATICTKS